MSQSNIFNEECIDTNEKNYNEFAEDAVEYHENSNRLLTQEVSFFNGEITQHQLARLSQVNDCTSTDESDIENETIIVKADVHNNMKKLPDTNQNVMHLANESAVEHKNLFTQSSQLIISPPDSFLPTQIKQDNFVIQDSTDIISVRDIFKKAVTAKDICEEMYHSDLNDDETENDLEETVKSFHNSQSSNRGIYNLIVANNILQTEDKFSQDLFEIENLSQELSLHEKAKNTRNVTTNSCEYSKISQQNEPNKTNANNNGIRTTDDETKSDIEQNINEKVTFSDISVQTEIFRDVSYLISRKRHLDALYLETPKRLKVHSLPLVLSDIALDAYFAHIIPNGNEDDNQNKKHFANSHTQTDVNIYLENKTPERPRPMRIGLSRKSNVRKPLHSKSTYFFGK